VVGARLERDVERRAGGIAAAPAAVLERGDLGVRAAELGVEALADRLTTADDDGTDERIGTDPPTPPLGQLERPPQVRSILLCSDRGQVGLLVIDWSVSQFYSAREAEGYRDACAGRTGRAKTRKARSRRSVDPRDGPAQRRFRGRRLQRGENPKPRARRRAGA
jgi:hypothetical protein